MVTHVVSNSSKPQIKICSSNESITVENNSFSKTLFNGKLLILTISETA